MEHVCWKAAGLNCLHPSLRFSKSRPDSQYHHNFHDENGKGKKEEEEEERGEKKKYRYLEGMALDHHGDVAVEALQPLLVQTLQDIVAKVWDRHLEGLGHGAPTHTTKGS